MEPFKLIHAWEGRPDEYAAYFLYERMKHDGCVDSEGKIELVQRDGMFCQAPVPYTPAKLSRLIRNRIININHIIKIDCEIHPVSCVNFKKEQQIVYEKQNQQAILNNNISLLSDKEREELAHLNRWLHEKQIRTYFTQYDEYIQEYFVRMYQITLSDGEAIFIPELDLRSIIGNSLFEQLTIKPNS